ncbi:hypothetical protein [Oceanibacterium hippocampi]|uniref:GcrA cell cycle regulator n=1 Tax=Oceanibacterium hippocampi TaxID=745714 RepID=A0A1Y5U3G1_9PROT|nr:hypothetical protein [Oceanibacterium hippocampi]SLN77552.1 hypothetical protein OCH7691_04456 [Oceanibacterium hippocampi]
MSLRAISYVFDHSLAEGKARLVLPAPLACQWMDGHPGEGGRFCGAPVVPGSSWCPAHRARVFLPADQQPAPLRWLPS